MNVITIPAKPKQVPEVPLSLRACAGLIEKHKGKGDDADFDALVATADEIGKCAETVQTTCEKILGNEMAMPIKRTADAKKAAHKLFEKIAPKLDSTRKRVETVVEQLEKSTLPPAAKDAVSAVYYGEVRSALLRMPIGERAKAVRSAIASGGDDQFVAAALLGNPVLTGLGVAERDALLHEWRRIRHQDVLERIGRLRGGLDRFNHLSSLLGGYACGLFADENDAISRAEASMEQASAAMADVAGAS